MAHIEFSTMCYAIDANKEGLSGSTFRERTRNALIAHYTSPLISDSQLPIKKKTTTKHRAVVVDDGIHALKEPVTTYMVYIGHQKQVLSDNTTITSM